MKFITKLYLKSFLIYGLSFAALMFLWAYLSEESLDLPKQLITALLFGILMSWATVTAQTRALRRLGNSNEGELKEGHFNVSQSLVLRTENNLQEIYNLLNIDQATRKWRFKFFQDTIIGRTNISWASWGEKIIISKHKESIKVESKPLLKTTLFDKGKNRENVILLKQIIERR